MTRFGRHESEDAADDCQDAAGRADRENERDDSEDDIDDPARAVLAAVDEEAPDEDCNPEKGGDSRIQQAVQVDGPSPDVERVDEDEQPRDEPNEHREEGEDTLLRHGAREGVRPLQPFSRPPTAQIPAGSPGNSLAPHHIRSARNTSLNPVSRTNSSRAPLGDGPLSATAEAPAESMRARHRSSETLPEPGSTTHGPISHAPPLGFPTMNPRSRPRCSATKNVPGNSSASRAMSSCRFAPKYRASIRARPLRSSARIGRIPRTASPAFAEPFHREYEVIRWNGSAKAGDADPGGLQMSQG